MASVLDIIITHHNEPLKKFRTIFDMLNCQRGVAFDSFFVIVVQDGDSWNGEDLREYISVRNLNYKVFYTDIPHAGVSSARNHGLSCANAEWVLFCDCDDTFSSIYSLKQIMEILTSEKSRNYDMLWMPFYIEDKINGEIQVHPSIQNNVFIHGRILRRDFLERNNIRFCPDLYFSEDSAFCCDIDLAIDHNRIGQITSTGCLYAWCYSDNSETTLPQNKYRNIIGLFKRHRYVIERFREHGLMFDFRAMICRSITDYYYQFAQPDLPETFVRDLEADFDDFWHEYGAEYHLVNDDILYKCLSATLTESRKRKDFHEPTETFRQWADRNIPKPERRSES